MKQFSSPCLWAVSPVDYHYVTIDDCATMICIHTCIFIGIILNTHGGFLNLGTSKMDGLSPKTIDIKDDSGVTPFFQKGPYVLCD